MSASAQFSNLMKLKIFYCCCCWSFTAANENILHAHTSPRLFWRVFVQIIFCWSLQFLLANTEPNHSIYFNGWRNRSNNNINISMTNFILFTWIFFFVRMKKICRLSKWQAKKIFYCGSMCFTDVRHCV